MPKKPTSHKTVAALTHEADKRKNIPSAEQRIQTTTSGDPGTQNTHAGSTGRTDNL